MSLSNIGKLTSALKGINSKNIYTALKGYGSLENAAKALSKYSNYDTDTKARLLANAFDLNDISEATEVLNNVGEAATGVGGKLAEMATTGKSALSGLWTIIKAHPVAIIIIFLL